MSRVAGKGTAPKILIALGVLLAAAVVAAVIFVVAALSPQVQSPDTVSLHDLQVGGDSIAFNVRTWSSALLYSGTKYSREGDALYLRVYHSIWSGEKDNYREEIHGDFAGISTIYLEGGGASRLVWQAQTEG